MESWAFIAEREGERRGCGFRGWLKEEGAGFEFQNKVDEDAVGESGEGGGNPIQGREV